MQSAQFYYVIHGFGFKVVYDIHGRVYITLDPFYAKRVSQNLYDYLLLSARDVTSIMFLRIEFFN